MENGMDEIRRLRMEAGMTGREMAGEIGLSPQHYSRIENGRAPLTKTVELAVRYVAEKNRTAPQSEASVRLAALERIAAVLEKAMEVRERG
jgi:transcriptional regulator with XRE-family HTH domain